MFLLESIFRHSNQVASVIIAVAELPLPKAPGRSVCWTGRSLMSLLGVTERPLLGRGDSQEDGLKTVVERPTADSIFV
ncbi:MAG: hypothetical protein M2R45_04909 [Verrucomicrobia subdivision 3 bacterium]|nr:hypothetical protein [Limisphaerales bacterium]MCS1417561.1 hypothetical protein [Limisphaerales bacterium]